MSQTTSAQGRLPASPAWPCARTAPGQSCIPWPTLPVHRGRAGGRLSRLCRSLTGQNRGDPLALAVTGSRRPAWRAPAHRPGTQQGPFQGRGYWGGAMWHASGRLRRLVAQRSAPVPILSLAWHGGYRITYRRAHTQNSDVHANRAGRMIHQIRSIQRRRHQAMQTPQHDQLPAPGDEPQPMPVHSGDTTAPSRKRRTPNDPWSLVNGHEGRPTGQLAGPRNGTTLNRASATKAHYFAWSRTFPAARDQAGEARRYLAALLGNHPAATDAITCLAELCANAPGRPRTRTRTQDRPGTLRPSGHHPVRPHPQPAPAHCLVRDRPAVTGHLRRAGADGRLPGWRSRPEIVLTGPA